MDVRKILYIIVALTLFPCCVEHFDFSEYENDEEERSKTVFQMVINNLDSNRESDYVQCTVSSDLQYWYPGIDSLLILPSMGEMYKKVEWEDSCPDTYMVEKPMLYEGCKYVHRFAVHYILNANEVRTYYYCLDTVLVTGYIDTIRYVYPQDTIYASRVEVR